MVEPEAETETESPAARLVDELLGAGEIVDDGQFSLDPVAAAAKFEAFAYADRSLYLIPILEGLIGLGAQSIALETVGEDLLIRGTSLRLDDPKAYFLELYAHALGRGADARARAIGRLAIGLDMILGGPATKRVQLRYSGSTEAVLGEYRRRAAPQVRSAEIDVIGELSILIDHPWISILDSGGRAAALAHLREAVRFSDRAVSLDGEVISGPREPWFETLRGEGPGFAFSAGLEQTGEPASVIELWTGGVCIETLPAKGLAFTAVIELDAPRRDLSQLKLVRDETLERALALVEDTRLEAYRRLEAADASWTEAQRPGPWSRAWVDRVLGRESEPSSPAPTHGLSKHEQRVPLGPLLLFARSPQHSGLALAGVLLGTLGLTAGVTFIATAFGPWLDGLDVAQKVMIWGLELTGVGLLGFTPRMRIMYRILHARDFGVHTRATITKIEERDGVWGYVLWSFEDEHGNKHQGRSLQRSLLEAQLWSPDEAIMIYYDPERPDESCWEADVGPRSGTKAGGARARPL